MLNGTRFAFGPTVTSAAELAPSGHKSVTDTNGDQANSLVQVRGAMSTAGFATAPFVLSGAYTINTISIANSGETVPWYITQPWWAYQAIAPDYANAQSFFVTWGGDARNVSADGTSGYGGVYGATVTY